MPFGGMPAGSVGGGVLNVEGMINALGVFTSSMQAITASLSNLNVTHTVMVDGQINVGGINVQEVAIAVREKVTELVQQTVNSMMRQQPNQSQNPRVG